MSRPFCKTFLIACVMGADTLAGCSSIPTSGASGAQIARAAHSPSGIQIVDVTEDVARQLFAHR
ncbi:polysaccharide export protein, partial [Burkholderia pseudomallei]